MRLSVKAFASAALISITPALAGATPYASGINKTGTTVNFILNEPADALTYSINGGAPVALNGATAGAKTFNLGAESDTFSIVAAKNSSVGFTIPTGGMTPTPINPNPTAVPPVVGQEYNGLRVAWPLGGYSLISDEANVLTRFNSPRGVGVNTNPNTPNFGTAYVANSANSATFASRDMTNADGIYAIRADGSDAFAYGNVAQNPVVTGDTLPAFIGTSTNSPYRVTVNAQGEILVSDYADANSNVFLLNGNLTTAQNLFPSYSGTATLPAGQNHGSVTASYSTGSLATGDLVVYTMDEDLTAQYFIDGTTPLPGTDHQSIWRYEIGAGPLPSAVTPTQIPSSIIGFAAIATADFDLGADGKIYTSQNRSAGNESGIFVLDSTGTQLWASKQASRDFLNDQTANDILTSVTGGVAVSPDQKWIATVLNRSDVAVMPLVGGLPDISKLLVIDTTTTDTENQGRDIAFDAAGNIHYVSSGQGRYRVIAPGGNTIATTTWNGTAYSFAVTAPAAVTDADFDGDGDIDGADFLTWQKNLGTTSGATLAQGDADGNGAVNAADLAIWQTQFATATPVTGAVPEPASASLLLLAAVGAGAARRRKV